MRLRRLPSVSSTRSATFRTRPVSFSRTSLRYSTAFEFSDLVLKNADKWNDNLLGFGNFDEPDGRTNLEAHQIVDHVAADPNGIGYVRFHDKFPGNDHRSHTLSSSRPRTIDDHPSHALLLRPMTNMTNSTNSLTRRTLLRTGALAAAAAALLPADRESETEAQSPAPISYAPATLKPPAPDADLPVRLGIASYTFRNFPEPAKLIDFMHQLKTPLLNLKSVHLPITTQDIDPKDLHPTAIPLAQVAAQAAAYRAAGFKLTAAGNITFALDTDEDIRPKFEYLKAAGIPIAVCAPTHQNLPRLEKFVKEYDIKLAIHNHGPEDKNFPSPFDVLAAVKNMDPRIGLCVDLGHALRAGADVVAAIYAAGPRLYDLHIKDLADVSSRESQVAVGEGVMPVRAIFQALIEINYPGQVDLEYEIHGDNPMPGVIESFTYMRGVLAGMGYK